MWIITNGKKYYGGIVRQTTGLFKDEINMVRKSNAKTFKDIGYASGAAARLNIRFGMKLKARRVE